MTRFEYIDALRAALAGLPPEVIARTVAEYEKRIYDASAAGRSEDDILAGLEDPHKVAEDLRAAHAPKVPAVVETTQAPPRGTTPGAGPAGALRMLASFVGLMVFNLFLIVPALAYTGLLIAAFAVSLACYVGGIAITSASVAGVNQLSLGEPFNRVVLEKPEVVTDMRSHDGRTLVNIGENGIHVEAGDKRIHIEPQGKGAMAQAGTAAASASVSAAAASTASTSAASASADAAWDDHHTVVDISPKGVIVKDGGSSETKADADADDDDGNVDVDMPGVHIHSHDVNVGDGTISLGTDFISTSQPVQVGVGIGITLAGIVGFLLCLVIARYTWLGVMKLAQLEFGVLRGA